MPEIHLKIDPARVEVVPSSEIRKAVLAAGELKNGRPSSAHIKQFLKEEGAKLSSKNEKQLRWLLVKTKIKEFFLSIN